MKNQLVIGNYDLSDWGVYFGHKDLFNAPKRNVKTVQVPGRNGDLVIDEGSWENIDVTYSCYLMGKAKERLFDLKQVILSQLGYVKISDSVNPNEFRLGYYKSGLDNITPSLEVKNARFDLVFNCKPQRFLQSGDEWRVHYLKSSGQAIEKLYNPTLFEFSPLFKIKVSGKDWGSISVDDYIIRVRNIHNVDYLYVDTETMDCYNGNQSLNDCVEFSRNSPMNASTGGRPMTVSANIEEIQIKTRWFTL